MKKNNSSIYDLGNISSIGLDQIYKECSGPGGLKLVDFMISKMNIQPHAKLLDVGVNRGFPTCYLTKKCRTFTVAIDPWNDLTDNRPSIEHVRENAGRWGVEDRIITMQTGVPDTYFGDNTFDVVYSTTTLEMIRAISGEEGYLSALKEIYQNTLC